MKIVTCYESPDLDGFSCAIAYSEFFNKKGIDARSKIFGNLQVESLFILNKFEFEIPKEYSITGDEEIILVDASELNGFNKNLDPKNVVEIIDHRKVNETHEFPNAKVQVEFVGAAATLIAEKYFEQNLEISKMAATLLYGAILSNTLNFQAKVTTDRDRKMAGWINEKLKLPNNFVHEMFEAKSYFLRDNLEMALRNDTACFKRGPYNLSITQLEMVGAQALIDERMPEIMQTLTILKDEMNMDLIVLSIIDLEDNYNLFLSEDIIMRDSLAKIFGIKFEGNVARREGLIMRKEILPLLKEELG